MKSVFCIKITILFILCIILSVTLFSGCHDRPETDATPTVKYQTPSVDEMAIPGEFPLIRQGNCWIRTDDNDSTKSIRYDGTWEVKTGEGYQDTMHFSDTPKSRVMIPFKGTRAKLYGKKGPDSGIIKIYVNLKEAGLVDLYSSEEISDVLLFDTGWMQSGMQIMTIKIESSKNEKSNGTGFYFDYLESYDVMDESYFVEIKQNLTGKMEARTFKSTKFSEFTLGYRIYIPENYDPSQRYPLVTFLHGASDRGSDNENQLNHPLFCSRLISEQEKYPCFIIAPQCAEDDFWNANTHSLGTTIELIDYLCKEYSIDEKKLIIGGLSMGGYGTWSAITYFPGKFEAAIPVCGAGEPEKARRIKNTRIWAFHGDLDDIVPVDGTRDMIRALKEAGQDPIYYEYPGIYHGSYDYAFRERDLLEWIFAK